MSIEDRRAGLLQMLHPDMLAGPEFAYLLDHLILEVRAAMPCYDLGVYVCGEGPRIVGATEYCPSCAARRELTG